MLAKDVSFCDGQRAYSNSTPEMSKRLKPHPSNTPKNKCKLLFGPNLQPSPRFLFFTLFHSLMKLDRIYSSKDLKPETNTHFFTQQISKRIIDPKNRLQQAFEVLVGLMIFLRLGVAHHESVKVNQSWVSCTQSNKKQYLKKLNSNSFSKCNSMVSVYNTWSSL